MHASLLLQRLCLCLSLGTAGERIKLPHDIKWFAAAGWFDQQLRVLESVQYYSGGQYYSTHFSFVTLKETYCAFSFHSVHYKKVLVQVKGLES